MLCSRELCLVADSRPWEQPLLYPHKSTEFPEGEIGFGCRFRIGAYLGVDVLSIVRRT